MCDAVLPWLGKEAKSKTCPTCQKKVPYLKAPFCMKCGKPVGKAESEYCYDCSNRSRNWESGRNVFLYKGSWKDTMYRFKYARRREYALFFAEEAKKYWGSWIERQKIDYLIPIPMYEKKKRLRGYNQAEDFAKALGKECGIQVRTDYVKRIRPTVPMKGLGRKEREQNLRQAFQVQGSIPKGKRILLVDDIYTTGSTIDAVAKEIKKKDQVQIYFLCACVGQGN